MIHRSDAQVGVSFQAGHGYPLPSLWLAKPLEVTLTDN